LREGHCIFNNGFSDLSVLVRNISATGAKLTGDELHFLPDQFELRMSDGLGGVVTRRAKRMWSKPDSMGVVFLDAARDPSGDLPPPSVGRAAQR
jgi:hypothetical protein